MARSFHTDPPGIQAYREAIQHKNVRTLLPRMIERRPRPGDVTPIGKSVARNLLLATKPKYFVGIKAIEFLPRIGEVGFPFGCYYSRDQRVVLYSLPLEWPPMKLNESWRDGLNSWGAEIEKADEGHWIASWPSRRILSIWFYSIVFNHELGHHYHWQYRQRNANPEYVTRRGREIFANMHRRRLLYDLDSLFDVIKD
jgi:hypothetical protein